MAKKIGFGFLTFLVSLLLFFDLIALVHIATLKNTAMDEAFITQELDEVGIYPAAEEYLDEEVNKLDLEIEGVDFCPVITDFTTPKWLKEQIEGALDTGFAYLNGETDTLEVGFATVELKDGMKTTLRETVLDPATRPETLKGKTDEELEPYLNDVDKAIDQLPVEITFGVEDTSQLEPIRDIWESSQTLLIILIMVAVVLVLFLIFLHFSWKGAIRWVGVPLLITGIVCYVGNVTGRNILSDQITTMDLPSPLTADMVTQMVNDIMSPAGTYAIIIGAIGLVLVVVSFFLREIRQRLAKPALKE